jgi:mono/diheme cytochrome c family protein
MWSWSAHRVGAVAAVCVVFWLACALTRAQAPADTAAAENAAGWQIPKNAEQEQSPLATTAQLLKKGKDLFSSNCQKCHGPKGRGDGPNGDPDSPPADLRASTAPDGIMFYKIWNGRKAPVMPPFKSTMTRDEIWTVIAYAKSLRLATAR